MAESHNCMVKSLYDLPTYQRRLRHVRTVTLRNLQCNTYQGKDIAKLQVFFTLHTDAKLKEFYRSEVISGSLNPSWQSFDISRYEEEIDIQAKYFAVRVWIGNSRDDNVHLLLEWFISLSGLTFFSDKLQRDKYKYESNMLIVGMFDKYFIAPQVSLSPEQELLLLTGSSVLVRNSYTINSLSRIHTVLRAIKQMQASVKRVHRSIEDKLLTSNEKTHKLCVREDLLLRVAQLKNELAWQMNKLQTHKHVLENCQKAKQERSHDLKVQFHQLQKNRVNLEEKRKLYFQTREKYIKENAQLLIRRKQLISELTTYIYPITELPSKPMCICGVRLPNSENFQGKDDMMYAVSLGYTCQLMIMMSQILDFPLRYLMDFKGSHSTITDHIHAKLTDKDKIFPLYSKGKEKFQFNYGVFLMNKNISQLRFYCGLGTTDLRLTLPNIKSMLELRLGVKFDNLGTSQPLQEVKDSRSIPSNDRDETISSLTSGGKNSVPDPAEEALENALKNGSPGENTNSQKKENIAISLNELHVDKTENGLSDEEDLFKPSDDNFFKLKTRAFVDDSYANSSCGSFSEQTNGLAFSNRNYSLSPSPGSPDNNVLAANQTGLQCATSKTSLLSFDLSSGEDHQHEPGFPCETDCDTINIARPPDSENNEIENPSDRTQQAGCDS